MTSASLPTMSSRRDSESSYAAIELLNGNSWINQYRLEDGHRVLIGRDETNHLRINDDSCSRTHCEVFQRGDEWVLRDSRSRNGTKINDEPIRGDVVLSDGVVFEIGETRLKFVVTDNSLGNQTVIAEGKDTNSAVPAFESDTAFPTEAAFIVREAENSVLSTADPDVISGDSSLAKLFAEVYQLASKIASAKSVRQLCETALDVLLERTAATFGGVLLLPSTKTADRRPDRLELKALRAEGDLPYARVSEKISGYIFKANQGVHWHTIDTAEEIATADSVHELSVASAACVPLKFDGKLAGLIHLYSQNIEEPISDVDFEFLLAVGEQVSGTLRHLVESKHLGDKLKKAEAIAETLQDAHRGQTEIVGDSQAIHTLRAQIAKIAPTDATVLVRGESGVGKELVAQAMHYASGRSRGPFVCMNCAALTESLLESELFGHEKGSFTGATGKKIGKFEQADGGTLLLDEVGEMTLPIQAKFLRVLEGHPFERVGGSQQITVDVRVVAATNRDLEDAVREGTFRKDLYFRLQVMQVEIPALRERLSDVPLLAQHFVEKVRKQLGRHVKGLSPAAATKLTSYHWPGNIRELQNTIERAVILCEGQTVRPDDIFLSTLEESSTDIPTVGSFDQGEYQELSIEEVERAHILRTLDATEWNKTRAAQILGIERSTLDRKLKRYGVSRPESVT